MPARKYNKEIVELYHYLQKNPYATYEQIELHFEPERINANSLVKRLQRMGCVKIERENDPHTGKIIGSKKECLKFPQL